MLSLRNQVLKQEGVNSVLCKGVMGEYFTSAPPYEGGSGGIDLASFPITKLDERRDIL